MSRLFQLWWWWVQDYAYAGYWQIRGLFHGRAAEDYVTGGKRPILVIPGIYETWHFLRPLIDRLNAEGHPVHVVAALRRNGSSVVEAGEIVAEYLVDSDLREVIILAHSKGGLIGKLVMSERDPDHRVDRMIAVAAPFSGSRYAAWMLLPALRSFSPLDATTVKLGRDLFVNRRITSIYGRFDPHIPEGSELPGAQNIRVDTGGHFRVLGYPEVVRFIVDSVADR